ncbi:hypothetical protein COO60DRAFT_1589438 [Scenedesmus sp. NREL 46B-D3]|nr:hypothetical protein COO60DRAFT_1589438 [Scenedesmus sp. NREL 46B-D3]
MLLACPVGTITHLLACVMLVGGLLVPCQQLTSSYGTACPISRIVLGLSHECCNAGCVRPMCVLRQQFIHAAAVLLHALAPIWQALVCYVS